VSGPAPESGRRRVNLALQGGGAHGAFTWGALDRLLEDDGLEIEGVTATSAGAMNAAALKSGMVAGGREGARRSLERFWLKVAGLDGALPEGALDWLLAVAPSPAVTARALELSPLALATEAVTRVLSPYQFNPTNYHPMRAIVTERSASILRFCASCAPSSSCIG
jgi:NTE family protein